MDTPMTDRQVEFQFERLLQFCRALKEQNRICSGVIFKMMPDLRIEAHNVPPAPGSVGERIGVEQVVQLALTSFQGFRERLSRSFDFNSNRWNNSPIGKMTKYIEENLRGQLYKIQGGHIYNGYTLMFIAREAADLCDLAASRTFPRRSWNQLKVLNSHALKFNRRNERRIDLVKASTTAELIIAFDDVRRARSGEEAIKDFMRKSVADGRTFETLYTFFYP